MGIYKTSDEEVKQNNEPFDVYDVVSIALHYGIRYEDLGHMNFVELSNILNAFKPKKHKPTQAEIDLIT